MDNTHSRRGSTTDLLLLLMAVIWGANFAVVKQALSEILPLSFNALRFSLASVFLFFALKFSEGGFLLDRKDLKGMLVLGVIGHTAYQLLFIMGISRTTASLSALMLATSPLFVAVLNLLTRVEKPSRRVFLGMFLSLAGVFMLVGGSSPDLASAQTHVIGAALVLAGSACWAAYTLLSKPYLVRYSPLRLTATTLVLGTILLDLLAVPSILAQEWQAITFGGWVGLLYSFGFALVLGYVIWDIGVHRIGPGRTAVYQNLIPVVATAVSYFWLQEMIGVQEIIGAAMVLVGVYLTRRP